MKIGYAVVGILLWFTLIGCATVPPTDKSPKINPQPDTPLPSTNADQQLQYQLAITSTDVLYELHNRASIDRAMQQLQQIIAQNPCFEHAYWRLARCQQWYYEHETDKNKKKQYAEQGIQYAKKGINCNKNCGECQYYYAILLGLNLQLSPLGALDSISEMIAAGKQAVLLTPTFDYAGPHRLLGYIYLKAPEILGIGDLDLALEHFTRAVELAPNFAENLIGLAMAYIEDAQYEQAKKLLLQVSEQGRFRDRKNSLAKLRQEAREAIDDFPEMDAELKNLRKKLHQLQREVRRLKKVAREQQSERETDKPYLDLLWDKGIHLKTSDDAFSMTIGGRIFVDMGFANEDSAIDNQIDDFDNFIEFRTARLHISGTIYERFVFKSEFDLANNVSFKDVYLGVTQMPFDGTLTLGYFKEPFGLEHLTDSRFTSFMERASLADLAPGRSFGISYYGNFLQYMTLAFGLFRETEQDDPPNITADSGAYAFTARTTALPFFAKEGERLLHLGLNYSFRNPIDNALRYRAHPETHLGPSFVDTGIMENLEKVHLLGAEGALVWGPFSLQSEWVYSWNRFGGEVADDVQEFWGYYVFASIILTGENRNYQPRQGIFDRIRPNNNLFAGGIGALELAVRYSRLDLNDEIRGRRMDNLTVGINSYINPNMRIMFNYIYSRVSHIDDFSHVDAHIWMTRFQIDF